jgi:2-dehydro-3-deoxygluconokinase
VLIPAGGAHPGAGAAVVDGAFDGAFLAEFVRSADPFGAARFAARASALPTHGFGAVAPLPRRAEVEDDHWHPPVADRINKLRGINVN